MSKFIVYIKLDIKKALKTIPYLLLGAITLVLLIGVIAFCSSKLLYKNEITKQIDIGVSMPKNDSMAELGISLLTSMESVKSFCNFIYLEEEEALRQLSDHKLFAVLVIPTGFVQGIMDGSNIPVVVVLPEDIGIEASLLKELTDAGENMLSSSQAGIYAATDYCIEHGLQKSIPEVERELNRIYMDFVLSRDNYFKEVTISATGEMTVVEYYVASAFLLFLLLCGIPCSAFLKRESKALRAKLKIAGVRPWQMVLSKWIAVTILYFIIILILGGISLVVYAILGNSPIDLSIPQFLAIIPVIMSVSAMIIFIYEIMKSPVESVMLLFISTIIMIFLSGGFIPIGFLPEMIGKISPWIPTTFLLNQMGAVITEDIAVTTTMITIMIAFSFYIMSIGINSWRQSQQE